jgi:hypothetical protein
MMLIWFIENIYAARRKGVNMQMLKEQQSCIVTTITTRSIVDYLAFMAALYSLWHSTTTIWLPGCIGPLKIENFSVSTTIVVRQGGIWAVTFYLKSQMFCFCVYKARQLYRIGWPRTSTRWKRINKNTCKNVQCKSTIEWTDRTTTVLSQYREQGGSFPIVTAGHYVLLFRKQEAS